MSHFLEIDTTPSDEACIILHHHYGDASGPITGDYKCATSWKFIIAIHQQIFDYDDDLQTWQTLYGCGPRTLDGSVWNGDFWCDAVDALEIRRLVQVRAGAVVGASAPTTSAPTEFQTPPFNVDGNTTSTCITPHYGAQRTQPMDPEAAQRRGCTNETVNPGCRAPRAASAAQTLAARMRWQSPSLVRGRRRKRRAHGLVLLLRRGHG